MLDVEITIKVPQERLDRVQAAGLRIEDLPTLIDAQLKRIERPEQVSADLIQSRIEQLCALEPKLTQDEIDTWTQEAQNDLTSELLNASHHLYSPLGGEAIAQALEAFLNAQERTSET